MLIAGELDRRIRIDQVTNTINDYGERIKSYSLYKTVWAKVDWKRSSEKEESNQRVQVSDVVFYIRNLDITIDPDMRILYNSKYYFVNGVKEIDGRERFLEIETKEKE
jgi:SPP1 family predicted phage head-tail adaptor